MGAISETADALIPAGSPIVRLPRYWGDLSFAQKRDWLIRDGQAADVSEASSLLSRHGHAMQERKKQKQREAEARLKYLKRAFPSRYTNRRIYR